MNNFTEEQRAKFEAWAKSQGYALNLTRSALNPSGYATVPTQGRWLAFYAGWTAALSAQEGGGGDEYQSAITQDQVDRARNAFFKKMMLGFGVDDCFFAALHAAREGASND